MANQCLLKKVVELFGNQGKVAAIKELQQIHDMDTYTPMDPKKLSWGQKNKTLSELFFLAEKHNDNIKARKVARGDKQHMSEG